jgi:hypothetical protein
MTVTAIGAAAPPRTYSVTVSTIAWTEPPVTTPAYWGPTV